MNTLISACADYLGRAGIPFEEAGDGEYAWLHFEHAGQAMPIEVKLQAWPTLEQLTVSAWFPVSVPSDMRAAVAELIARLNGSDLAGVFILDFNNGDLSFERTLDIEFGILPVNVLSKTLYLVVNALDSCHPCLREVISGRQSAHDSYRIWNQEMADSGLSRLEGLMSATEDRVERHECNQEILNHRGMMPQMMDNYTELSGWTEPATLLAVHSTLLFPLEEHAAFFTSLIGGRSENQDYGLVFRLGSAESSPVILVVADGLGGHPGGRAASYLACKGVAEAAASHADLEAHELLAVLQRGAEASVAAFAAQMPPETCLTTVIVAVVMADKYCLAWVGDGGACVRRRHGQWESLMEPHRGPSGQLHEVGAYLGAQRYGFWSVSESPRLGGDLLLLGTDGVMERTFSLETFFRRPRISMADGATIQTAMTDWLLECAQKHPLVFDDNLTLTGLITPFWMDEDKQHR